MPVTVKVPLALLFFPGSVFFQEMIFHQAVSQTRSSVGTLMLLLYSFVLGCILYLPTYFIRKRSIVKTINGVILAVIAVLFLVEFFIVQKFQTLFDIRTIVGGAKGIVQDFAGATIQGQMNTVYDEVIDQIEDVNHKAAAETFPAAIQALQSGAIDGVVSELPVALGVTEANPDLTIVRFAEGQGFTANTTVSIAVRKTDPEFQAQLEGALSQITEEERNQMMEAAVERQPAENE